MVIAELGLRVCGVDVVVADGFAVVGRAVVFAVTVVVAFVVVADFVAGVGDIVGGATPSTKTICIDIPSQA